MAHNSATAPFSHDGGTTGVLLSHGFTGSPASMQPWAEYMARHGYSVRLPLLPGHGTTWQDMARTRWQDWYDADLAAFRELRQRCARVFVFGLSMGGTLVLRLAEELGDEVTGIVAVNPLVHRMPRGAAFARYIHPVMPSLKAVANDIKRPSTIEYAYDRVPVRSVAELHALSRRLVSDIERVTQPMLLVTSVEDHTVDPVNSAWLAAHARSTDITSLVLTDSYHVAPLDNDADRLFAAALGFVQRLDS